MLNNELFNGRLGRSTVVIVLFQAVEIYARSQPARIQRTAVGDLCQRSRDGARNAAGWLAVDPHGRDKVL